MEYVASKTVSPVEGELFRLHVRSRTDLRQWYLVDLEAYNGNGWCACQRFEFAMEGILHLGAYPARHLRCWHIEEGRDFWTRSMIATMAKNLNPVATDTNRKARDEQTNNGRNYTLDRSRVFEP